MANNSNTHGAEEIGTHAGPFGAGAGVGGDVNRGPQIFQHGSGAVPNRNDATGGGAGGVFPPLRPEAAVIDWSIFNQRIGGGGEENQGATEEEEKELSRQW